MKKVEIIFIIMISCMSLMYGQTVRTLRHVIIDTDCGADDARVSALWLSSPDTEVLCFTTTDGVLSAHEGAEKICTMLSTLHHEGIPVAASIEEDFIPSHINAICATAYWGDKNHSCMPMAVSSDSMMAYSIINSVKKPIVVACGPLTSVACLIKNNPDISHKIAEIIWSNEGWKTGYNYYADTTAAHIVMESGIPIKIVSESHHRISEKSLMRMCKRVDNPYSKIILGNALSVYPHVPPLSDMSTVLYVYYPDMFYVEENDGLCMCTIKDDVDKKDILTSLEKILRGDFYAENQLFDTFPMCEKHYRDDVKHITRSLIKRYGPSEWRAAVLTGELHGHIGLYAIIGVKMGIRAREYMGVGVDDIKITSYTQSSPPQSCLNDGLQVSTGGTLGHGLIALSNDDTEKGPYADFQYGGKKIRLILKPHIKEKIEKDIMDAFIKYGLNTPSYWERIRELTLAYWQNMDRYEMFDIKNLNEMHM